MKRRQWLQMMGSMGLLGFSPALRAQPTGGKRRLLVIFNRGGWDPSYVFDPHFDSSFVDSPSDSTLEEMGGIPFADSHLRPSVRLFFEQYAASSCVVNGIAVGSISHPKCEQLFMTGSRDLDAPDFPAMVAHGRGETAPLPYLVMSGPRMPGRFGALMAPVDALFGGILQGEQPVSASELTLRDDLIADYLQSVSENRSGRLAEDYRASLKRRAGLDEFAHLFDVPTAPTFQESVALAADALANDIAVSAMVQGPLPDLVRWDSHSDNTNNQNKAFERLFDELISVMSMLNSQSDSDGVPLIETTTLAVVSEMGRTPVMNGAGGKDHWPYTSALLVGAGIKGGQLVGGTDDSMLGTGVDFASGAVHGSGQSLTVPNLLSGLLQSFDVDGREFFPNDDPFTAPFTGS